MNANIGSLDRQLRIGGGFILITLALTGVLGPWAWIGVVPIATGVFNLCPLYSLIGVNSCSIEGIETNVDGWSPYIAGALVGLLAIASVYLTTVYMGKSTYLGASTTFVRAAGMTAGQWATHGTRMPPSVKSILPPTNGQLSEKRSPPLSLVKTIRVLSSKSRSRSDFTIQPMPSSIC